MFVTSDPNLRVRSITSFLPDLRRPVTRAEASALRPLPLERSKVGEEGSKCGVRGLTATLDTSLAIVLSYVSLFLQYSVRNVFQSKPFAHGYLFDY